MERFYNIRNKTKKEKERKKKELRGLVIKLKGRIKGISRTRKLTFRKGKIGSLNYYSSKLPINTKWGVLNLTILRNTSQ